MTHLAALERAALCDTFDSVGPAAPTLCDPWTTAELAAHLVIRERRLDLSAGTWVSALSSRTDRAIAEYAAKPWPELVGLLRSGPPAWSPTRVAGVDNSFNFTEFFVHHEDVLRAGAHGPQREISAHYEAALWKALQRSARVLFRRARTGVVLIAPDHGRQAARSATDLGTVVLQGPPAELLLTAYGRSRVAAIEPQGSPEAVEALLASPFGI